MTKLNNVTCTILADNHIEVDSKSGKTSQTYKLGKASAGYLTRHGYHEGMTFVATVCVNEGGDGIGLVGCVWVQDSAATKLLKTLVDKRQVEVDEARRHLDTLVELDMEMDSMNIFARLRNDG